MTGAWPLHHNFQQLIKEHVYFEDPYMRMGKGPLPRQAFEEHWHKIGEKNAS